MDDDLTGLRNRQDSIENRVSHLEAKVDLEARLRTNMDKELGDIRATQKAHTRSLSALREVQAEHSRILGEHTRILDKHTRILDDHTQRLDRIEGDLVTVKTGVHAILDLLDANLGQTAD